MTAIDLNADLGERPDALDQDALILESITSANVACGFHAGSETTMRFVCERAQALGVSVGAHVSYRDRDGFGRRELDVDPTVLTADVAEQLAELRTVAEDSGVSVTYVKPHGALYNRCAWDLEEASAVVDAIVEEDARLKVLGLPDSQLLHRAAATGLTTIGEGYADRGYLPGGGLVPRGQPGAILDRDAAVEQGLAIALQVRSLCLHSDTPGAVELAAWLRAALERRGFEVAAF